MTRRIVPLALALAAGCAEAQGPVPDALPAHVTVRTVFFVPAGQTAPTTDQRTRLFQHLQQVRMRYIALGAVFYTDSGTPAAVVSSTRTHAFYAGRPEQGAPEMTAEVLAHFNVSRRANPYVFLIVVMNAAADAPTGGGRPINGGFNNGGGIAVISSWALDNISHIQSTLRHELGHAFGLVHVDAYGRNMATDSSMMSYNPAHHTNGLTDSPTPGTFSHEDRKALSLNQRVFEGLTYSGPVIPLLIGLNPMTLPGHPAF